MKATTRGYTKKENRLRVQVGQTDVDRMVACPAPTYLIGIDANRIGVGYLLSINEPRAHIASLTTKFKIDCSVLKHLRDEVIEYWQSRVMVLKGSWFREQEAVMAEVKDPWFVLERSEALAALLLTNHDDLEVVSRRKKDDGVDLIVSLDDGASPPTRLFVVQVKGTVSANRTDWMQNVKQLFRPGSGHLYLPTCVFVVNVRDNTTLFAWIAEPIAESDRATLGFITPRPFQGSTTRP